MFCAGNRHTREASEGLAKLLMASSYLRPVLLGDLAACSMWQAGSWLGPMLPQASGLASPCPVALEGIWATGGPEH